MILKRIAVLCAASIAAAGASAFGVDVHAEITRSVLERIPAGAPPTASEMMKRGFTTTAMQEIIDANKVTDTGDCDLNIEDSPPVPCKVDWREDLAALLRLVRNESPAHDHFDDEKIQEGSNKVFEAIGRIRNYLRQHRFVAARKTLGRALHGIQDFYAHTNWVELGNRAIEPRLGTKLNAFSEGSPRIALENEPTCVNGSRLLTDLNSEERQALRARYGDELLGRLLVVRPLTSGYFFIWGARKPPPPWTSFFNKDTPGTWWDAGSRQDIPAVTQYHKCRHGYSNLGITQPGINKDDDSSDLLVDYLTRRRGYDDAVALADSHTVKFVIGLLNDPELKNDPDLLLGLMGHEIVAKGQGTLVAPGHKKQAYTPFAVDLRKYDHGKLIILVQLARGESAGSFDLYPPGAVLPTDGDPVEAVTSAWDVSPGAAVTLWYPFSSPGRYTFGATGNWMSRVGSRNTFTFSAYVEDGKPRVR
jgi:hypothetical protein